jgi:hypothetical protein
LLTVLSGIEVVVAFTANPLVELPRDEGPGRLLLVILEKLPEGLLVEKSDDMPVVLSSVLRAGREIRVRRTGALAQIYVDVSCQISRLADRL